MKRILKIAIGIILIPILFVIIGCLLAPSDEEFKDYSNNIPMGYFTTNHVWLGNDNFNEVHAYYVEQDSNYLEGTYFNSHRNMSNFKAIYIGSEDTHIQIGWVTGYGSIIYPYIKYVTDGCFYAPIPDDDALGYVFGCYDKYVKEIQWPPLQ